MHGFPVHWQRTHNHTVIPAFSAGIFLFFTVAQTALFQYIEAPQWTEYIRDEEKLDLNTFARLAAIAEAAWTLEENKCYDRFESSLETLRSYFQHLGAEIAPAWMYHGDAIGDTPEEQRIEKGWELWKEDPYFEIRQFHEKKQS